MNSKKGFTLIELIAAIAVMAIITTVVTASFLGVKNSVLNKQYQNVKIKIETAAEKYAKDTSIITVSVAKLIETGYLTPDKGDIIYNPVTNTSLNCKIVEVDVKNGKYAGELTDKGKLNEQNDSCEEYSVKTDNLIVAECYSANNDATELNKCQNAINKTSAWYAGEVKLKPNETIENIANYRWTSLTGTFSNDEFIIVNYPGTLITTYSLSVTFESEKSSTYNKLIQIDNEKPIIVNVVKDDEWSNKNKKVTIEASDGVGSGVEKYYIGTNSSCPNNEFVTSNSKELGTGTYYACAMDAVGYKSDAYQFEIINIDTSAPQIKGSFATVSSKLGVTYYNQLIRSATFTDSQSEIKELKYCFTTSGTCTPTSIAGIIPGKESTAIFKFPTNKAAQKVCVKAIDNVGNESSIICDAGFLVDATVPTGVTAKVTSNPSIITVTGTDAESGINRYVCSYGTSSAALTKSVTVNSTAASTNCNIGVLESGKTYYVRVTAYNNAGLATNSSVVSYKSQVKSEDAFQAICGTSEYCDKPYYIDYNGYKFIVYRNVNYGYKAVYDGLEDSQVYLQTSCCNNGRCNYNGANYTNGRLSYYLNGQFLNRLSLYNSKLAIGTWNTGYVGTETARTSTGYVGLMDYREYNATKKMAFLYSNPAVHDRYHWLLNMYDKRYVNNVVIMYTKGNLFESSQYVNTPAYSRPVVVFQKGIVFTAGDGSASNPYRVF